MAKQSDDINALREELHAVRQRHSETLDHLTIAVAIFDARQELQYYNNAFQRLWDFDSALLSSAPTNGLLLDRLRSDGKIPEQPEWRRWKESVLSAYRSGQSQEDWWHLPDGRTIRVIANPQSSGEVTWTFENLTERIDLESRYNAAVRVQGETLDNLAEGVAVFGSDGRLQISNPAFASLWELEQSFIKPGMHISSLRDACSKSVAESPWDGFVSDTTGFDDERRDRQGVVTLESGMSLNYSVVFLPNGHTMFVFKDVTDSVNVRKAFEDKINSEHINQKMLANLSFELRRPINNIVGFSEIIRSGLKAGDPEAHRQYLEDIRSSAEDLANIIQSFDESSKVASAEGMPPLGGDKPAVSFQISNGSLNLRPFDWRSNSEAADRFRKKALKKVHEIIEQLSRTDSDINLREDFKNTVDILSKDISTIYPDILQIISRSIQSKASAYSHPEAKWEISAEVVSNLLEVAGLMQDWLSLVSSNRILNDRAISSLNINEENVALVKETNDIVTEIVRVAGDIISEDARSAIMSSNLPSLRHEGAVEQPNVEGERALIAENLALALARGDASGSNHIVSLQHVDVEGAQRWKKFSDEFMERFGENIAAEMGTAAREAVIDAIKKPVPTLAGVAALIASLSFAGLWVTGGLAAAATWIVFHVRSNADKKKRKR